MKDEYIEVTDKNEVAELKEKNECYYSYHDRVIKPSINKDIRHGYTYYKKKPKEKRLKTVEEMVKDGILWIVMFDGELSSIDSLDIDEKTINMENIETYIEDDNFKGYITIKDYIDGNTDNVQSFYTEVE